MIALNSLRAKREGKHCKREEPGIRALFLMVLRLGWGGFLETLNDGILFGFCSGDREEDVFLEVFLVQKMAINRGGNRENREKTGKQRKVKIWDFL